MNKNATVLNQLQPNMVSILGVPFDENASFMRGPALAPPHIREALHCGSANLCVESGLDLATDSHWLDVGDLLFVGDTAVFDQIEGAITRLLAHEARVLTLGGDHSITYPILRAYAQKYPDLTIVQLDAHPDLYDKLDGKTHSHACPFARIMENGLIQRLLQIGIRTMNPHQQEQADRFGVEVITARAWQPDKMPTFNGPVYLSLDMDVLDPAFAPGVSHHEPGGFSVRQVLQIIQSLPATIVGADIVEFNPKRDLASMTAMVAAKFLKEITARMIQVSER